MFHSGARYVEEKVARYWRIRVWEMKTKLSNNESSKSNEDV